MPHPSDRDITDDGERVTHLYPNSSFYAHLSIYRFALPFAAGGRVLDAGSGAGYGAAYLADHGAQYVLGIDASAKAVDFSLQHFQRGNLAFQAMDLGAIAGFAPGAFDLIFTSNTLEHITSVPAFLRAAATLLAPHGCLIVAVPPIYNAESRAANLANPYHLNIWSPRQWHATLTRYFAVVAGVRHHFEKPGVSLNFADTPERSQLREDDFLFLPSSAEELNTIGALTAIFVARQPRPAAELPDADAPPIFVDDSFSRLPLPQPAVVAPGGLRARLARLARRLGY